jgi:hypothetical protein
MTINPCASDPQDIWMLGQRHESGFSLKKSKRARWQLIKVQYFEGTGDSLDCATRLIGGRVYYGRRSKANGSVRGVVLGIVTKQKVLKGVSDLRSVRYLKSCQWSSTAPIKGVLDGSRAKGGMMANEGRDAEPVD